MCDSLLFSLRHLRMRKKTPVVGELHLCTILHAHPFFYGDDCYSDVPESEFFSTRISTTFLLVNSSAKKDPGRQFLDLIDH